MEACAKRASSNLYGAVSRVFTLKIEKFVLLWSCVGYSLWFLSWTESWNKEPKGDRTSDLESLLMRHWAFFEWYGNFKSERTTREVNEQSEKPTVNLTLINEKLQQPVQEDHWRTIKDISDIVGVSYGAMQAFLTSGFFKIIMHPVTKFPHFWVSHQKQHGLVSSPTSFTRLSICQQVSLP